MVLRRLHPPEFVAPLDKTDLTFFHATFLGYDRQSPGHHHVKEITDFPPGESNLIIDNFCLMHQLRQSASSIMPSSGTVRIEDRNGTPWQAPQLVAVMAVRGGCLGRPYIKWTPLTPSWRRDELLPLPSVAPTTQGEAEY